MKFKSVKERFPDHDYLLFSGSPNVGWKLMLEMKNEGWNLIEFHFFDKDEEVCLEMTRQKDKEAKP